VVAARLAERLAQPPAIERYRLRGVPWDVYLDRPDGGAGEREPASSRFLV
jgi:hypothetical protein